MSADRAKQIFDAMAKEVALPDPATPHRLILDGDELKYVSIAPEDLLVEQEPLEADFADVLFRNVWNLYAR